MFSRLSSLVFLFGSYAFAAIAPNPSPICLSAPSNEEVVRSELYFAAHKVDDSLLRSSPMKNVEVNVHWHVISTTGAIGDLNRTDIDSQMIILNTAFKNSATSISFKLVNVTRTLNPNWYNNAGWEYPGNDITIQDEMKRTLRAGAHQDLNIYSVGFTNVKPSGLGGYATFPQTYTSNPIDDGVVLLMGTVPGGPYGIYSHGGMLIHEVGHWVGLYHTFQGGCGADGDYVSDTPAENPPASQAGDQTCPVGRDTCPRIPGKDPIENYMTYTDDDCHTKFTPGQVYRLQALSILFRAFIFF